MKKNILFLIFFLICMLITFFQAGASDEPSPPVSFKWEIASLPENNKFLAILWIQPEKGWYTYSNNPGLDMLMPTQIDAKLLATNSSLKVFFPTGILKQDIASKDYFKAYTSKTPVFIPIRAPLSAININASVRMLLCSQKNCLPVFESLNFNPSHLITIATAKTQKWWAQWLQSSGQVKKSRQESRPSAKSKTQTRFSFKFKPRSYNPGMEVKSLGKAVLFAFLAGLILNFMPCVLPVITLKLRSLMPVVGTDRKAQLKSFQTHNLFFALGMLLYFLFLAVLIALTGMAWGQVFQSPGAIIALTAVVFALGLSLFGIYDLPVIDFKAHTSSNPKLESLFTGILATLLATPCSGPFLGSVLAWGLLQPPAIIAMVLLCIGLGMASPYLLLSCRPSLLKLLPRSGSWSLHLERILGFLLLGTCIYLFSLLPEDLILNTLILLWVISLAAWVWGKFTNLSQSALKRTSIRLSALILVAISSLYLFYPKAQIEQQWHPFTFKSFEQSLGQKNIVLDFTADWCPNCKFLEKAVLTNKNLHKLKEEFNFQFMQVDLTRENKEKIILLKNMGSQSIPVLAIFSKDKPHSPLVIRDLFTYNQLKQALRLELK